MMAGVKFLKGTEEWQLFMDYWDLCQKYWKTEDDNDEYWHSLFDDANKFANKYGTEFAKALAKALIESRGV